MSNEEDLSMGNTSKTETTEERATDEKATGPDANVIQSVSDSNDSDTAVAKEGNANGFTGKSRTPDFVADSVENYLQCYHSIAEWIRFADAKAAVVLTVNGALASILIPTLKPFIADRMKELGLSSGKWHWELFKISDFTCLTFNLSICFFFLWMATLVVSGAFAFLCIQPFRQRGSHPALGECQNFHPAAIASAYPINAYKKFVDSTLKLGMRGFEKQVLSGILIDAHISNVKYRRVTASIKFFAISAVFGFAYLLLKQI